MTRFELLVRYSLFAAISTVANLGCQRLVLTFERGSSLYVWAVLAGTGVGLAVKFVLDKRWIFYDGSVGAPQNSRKFGLYALMGGFTTIVFWGTESAFWFAFRDDLMREVGAVIGLTIGYFIKYRLDRRFVFTEPSKWRVQ